MIRGRISYSVGAKSPGDPFGISNLTIEPDGRARLVQDKREGLFVFTGTVIAAAMEDFWKALEAAGFPKFEMLPPKPGSGLRYLTVGAERVFLPYYAASNYGAPFGLLHSVIAQISLGMVKDGPTGAPIVENAQRATVARGRILYSVGSKNSPGDPWGRCTLTMELDGRARLEQDTHGGVFVFTGTVAPSALEEFWKAIEQSGFPAVPSHETPAGSASRDLTIGDVSHQLPIAYHSVASWPGYGPAFRIIDNVIRQISLDTVKEGPPGAPIVEGATKVS